MNEALIAARKGAGLTQQQLDELAGVTRGTTYELESGRTGTPAFDTGTKILRALQRRGIRAKQLDRIFPVEASR